MMLRHYGFLGALSVATAAVVACGSSDSGSGSGSGSTSQAVTTNFDGVYVPKTAGAIGSIAFSHGRDYLLMPTGCKSQGCSEIGTYTIDDAKSELVLTSSSGSARSLSLKVIATERKEATIAKTESVSGFALSVRDLINTTDSGSLVAQGDGGSLVALIQALINAITQAALGGQDMAQLGADDAGLSISIPDFDFSVPDAAVFTYPCSDAGAGSDSGADAGICTFRDCTTNLPTSTSTIAEIDVYFAICPYGPTTYYNVH